MKKYIYIYVLIKYVHLLAIRGCNIPEEFILNENLDVSCTRILKLCINANLRTNECKFNTKIMTGVGHIVFFKICRWDKKICLFTPQVK